MLKHIITLITVFTIAFNANSQIELKLTGGLAEPIGQGRNLTHYGFSAGLNKILKERFRAGIHIGRYFDNQIYLSNDLTVFTLSSHTNTFLGSFEYMSKKEKFRPYIGATAGLYSLYGKIRINEESQEITRQESFGVGLTTGVDYVLGSKFALNINVQLENYDLISVYDNESYLFRTSLGLRYTFSGK